MENALTSIGYRVHNMEELEQMAPAVFATEPTKGVTGRYSFISTEEIVQKILDLGWELHSAKQNGPNPFSRHHVRFVNPKLGFMDLNKDRVKPQIILDNSHNRSASAQIHMGLFRLVCTNGLVVAMPGMYNAVKFRHMGVDKEELRKLLEVAAEQYKKVGDHIADMQLVDMDQPQREEFAIKAVARREPHMFINADGTVNVDKVTGSTNPLEIISPIRGEDEATNLWTVFNVIQERMIKGGYHRTTGSGRNSTTRGITNATRSVEFNKELWGIAEEYMPETEEVTA
jgi:hypothetical protein